MFQSCPETHPQIEEQKYLPPAEDFFPECIIIFFARDNHTKTSCLDLFQYFAGDNHTKQIRLRSNHMKKGFAREKDNCEMFPCKASSLFVGFFPKKKAFTK
jgi:hypothetical protein